jgi:hypothetical protein
MQQLKETSAYLMTMLSEMLSAVLPYGLRILTCFTRDLQRGETKNVENRRTWQHCSLRTKRDDTHQLKGRRTKRKTNDQPNRVKKTKHKAFFPHIPSISSRLSLLTNHSAAAFALRGSVRSIGSQTSWPGCSPIPSFSIRAIASSAFSSLLAARYTLAPRLTRWSAMYRPIPEL